MRIIYRNAYNIAYISLSQAAYNMAAQHIAKDYVFCSDPLVCGFEKLVVQATDKFSVS
jgi:hypothetical protein